MHKTDDIVDLFVVGAPSIWSIHWLRRRAIESLLLGSGTPLLLLPEEARLPQIDRAVLGWRLSAESIRMAHDLAMLAEPGAHIDIVTIGEPAAEGRTRLARYGIIDFFTAHGFEAECHWMDDGRAVKEQLQDFALAAHADVLAVGGFGHSRIREIFLGGVTHALVAAPRLPVLLTH
jgi:nucleotide-binding universal stress UspA family protein